MVIPTLRNSPIKEELIVSFIGDRSVENEFIYFGILGFTIKQNPLLDLLTKGLWVNPLPHTSS